MATVPRLVSRLYRMVRPLRNKVEWSSAVEARSYAKKRMVNYPLVFFLYSTHVHRDKQKDLYAVLGVTPSATQAQIKAAFYDLSRTHHPDLNQGSEESHNRFSEISGAYEVLGSYELRKKYDKGVLYNYPNPSHQHPHQHSQRQAENKMYGKKVKFDFDEFYRAHYGETVRRRHRQEKERREEAARTEAQVLTEQQQSGLRLVVIAMVLVAGWIGHYIAVKNHKPKTKT